MKSLLYYLITENIDFHGSYEEQVRTMPGYTVAKARYDHACRGMSELTDPTARNLFLDYESASNAMTALQETAAAMVGFRMCLNLLTEVFRGGI